MKSFWTFRLFSHRYGCKCFDLLDRQGWRNYNFENVAYRWLCNHRSVDKFVSDSCKCCKCDGINQLSRQIFARFPFASCWFSFLRAFAKKFIKLWYRRRKICREADKIVVGSCASLLILQPCNLLSYLHKISISFRRRNCIKWVILLSWINKHKTVILAVHVLESYKYFKQSLNLHHSVSESSSEQSCGSGWFWRSSFRLIWRWPSTSATEVRWMLMDLFHALRRTRLVLANFRGPLRFTKKMLPSLIVLEALSMTQPLSRLHFALKSESNLKSNF